VDKMRIIYGTGNLKKVEQVKDFFKTQDIDLEILSLKDIGFEEEIEENGNTIEENSMIKAKAIKKYCDKNNITEIIVTDDTGLMVDALNGAPGIYSARYAGDHAPQEVAINKLLNEMKNVEDKDRTAHFECVLTAVLPNGEYIVEKGITEGKIAIEPGPMGKLTFGPIFIPNGYTVVMNELKDEELGYTHREIAFLKILEDLKK
jgi:XTP/dITP diphosphohydrolase